MGRQYEYDNKKYYKVERWSTGELTYEASNRLALEFFKRAAAQRNPEAMFMAGKMIRQGRGALQDDAGAFAYFKQGAEAGNADAMLQVGIDYVTGTGTTKDYEQAATWFRKVVDTPEADGDSRSRAQNALGYLSESGLGTAKDTVIAYAWYNLAAAGGNEKAKENRTRLERLLTAEETSAAQALSRSWKPGQHMSRSGSSEETNAKPGVTAGTASSSGSGFFVTSDGDLVTNFHVVSDCKDIRVPSSAVKATLRVADKANDLAVLKVDAKAPFVSFADPEKLRQGEEIAVFGFPLDGYLPASGNFTQGIVSALSGPANNSSLIQISAPVQPGNSGGPVMNRRGELVGLVVGKAPAIKIAQITGDVPQNVNFAISGRTLAAFLDANAIKYTKASSQFQFLTREKTLAEVADSARAASVRVECWR